jgi:hypothetical protein
VTEKSNEIYGVKSANSVVSKYSEICSNEKQEVCKCCCQLLATTAFVIIVCYGGAGTSRVAQSVQCLTTHWTAGVPSRTKAEDFFSNLCVQTGSGANIASYAVDTGGSFPGGKERPGRDADHSPPSSAEVKKE